MTNMDMSEAIGMLAQEKGLSEEPLLHVLVEALASAYKRRDDAADEVVVEVNPETMEFSFIAYDVDSSPVGRSRPQCDPSLLCAACRLVR